MSKALKSRLRTRHRELTASYVKQTIADLLQNKIDMSQLVITKALAKAGKLVQKSPRCALNT